MRNPLILVLFSIVTLAVTLKEGRSAWSRLLLFGPPGVGKTALVHAAAAEAGLPLFQASSADLSSAWLGNSEKLIRRLFTCLGERRCLLLLDEVDALCRRRNPTDSDHARRTATELLLQIQRYEGSSMFLVCATNCPWELDPAFLRRFQQRIYVPMPDQETRSKIILSCIGGLGELEAASDWQSFLRATMGLSGSDLHCLTRAALMLPLRELHQAKYWVKNVLGMMTPTSEANIMGMQCSLKKIPNHKVLCRPVKLDDLWQALRETDRTVTEEGLEPFRVFIKSHRVFSDNLKLDAD